jgi:hypothetical protein
MNELWRPIKTAPRNGTLILAYVPNKKFYRGMFLVTWNEISRIKEHKGTGILGFGWCLFYDKKKIPWRTEINPSYWMPLPFGFLFKNHNIKESF